MNIFDFLKEIFSLWPDVKGFFNSNFFTSITGAFAGAYGAQIIVERGKLREQWLNEIRNVNAASMIAFGICNSLLSLKKQHVKALKENHDRDKASVLEHHAKVKAGTAPTGVTVNYTADLQTLSLPPLPVGILQNLVFEKLNLNGRPLSLVTTLSQTEHSLNQSMEKRNQLIQFYRNSQLTQEQFAVLYFGLPYNGGHIDNDYPSCVDAIYSQTNDGIKFAQILCEDLKEHGEIVAKAFKKKFGKGAPKINHPDWSKAEQAGLMPPDSDYADWNTTFQKRKETSKWDSFKSHLCFWDKKKEQNTNNSGA
ncbi:MAG: hypothetical protein WC989_05175 [Micavibrio sp.]